MTKAKSKISFISEHTAEYILVPQICRAFAAHFRKVVPFYFWATREGSSVSHMAEPIQLVVVFPRRPKVAHPGADNITVKFNEMLFDAAKFYSQLSIPVFAGVPLLSSLDNLQLDCRCAWFFLRGDRTKSSDVECSLSLTDNNMRFSDRRGPFEGPLSNADVARYPTQSESRIEWRDAVRAIRSERRGIDWSGGAFWAPRGQYKPFYLALSDRRS